MELYIDGVKLQYNENEKFNDVEIVSSDRYSLNRNYNFTTSVEGHLTVQDFRALKKLLKLSRKKKKNLGQKKQEKNDEILIFHHSYLY